MHRHPELIYVRDGSIEITVAAKTETLNKNSFALVLPHEIHEYCTHHDSIIDICIFSMDFIPTFSKELHQMQADSAAFTCSGSVTAFADANLFYHGQKPAFYMLKSVLYAIVCSFLEQTMLSPKTNKDDILIYKMINYIENNFQENITLKNMAKKLGYEEHYLSRCFHNSIPMHFSRYVNWYRVNAATELLKTSELSIAEIALESGFQSIRNFNRVFLELTGTTPTTSAKNNTTL